MDTAFGGKLLSLERRRELPQRVLTIAADSDPVVRTGERRRTVVGVAAPGAAAHWLRVSIVSIPLYEVIAQVGQYPVVAGTPGEIDGLIHVVPDASEAFSAIRVANILVIGAHRQMDGAFAPAELAE